VKSTTHILIPNHSSIFRNSSSTIVKDHNNYIFSTSKIIFYTFVDQQLSDGTISMEQPWGSFYASTPESNTCPS
jgi:hypothetical protein